MTTKLYTIDNDGVEQEISTTCPVAELKPVTEYPEKEQFVRALKGLQSVSVECEVTISDDVAAELRKRHATWNAIRAAVMKLRKSCYTCRWLKLKRVGTNSRGLTMWYCKFKRDCYHVQQRCYCCEHFRRKCKSKP